MAIFSRGDMGGGALAGGLACPAAAGGEAAPPLEALLTAVWQGEDSWVRWLCRHCKDAAPPAGTLEQ
jgi:hypothetical protein